MQRFINHVATASALAVLLGLASVGAVLAQEGTPAASPESSQCTVEPRPVDFLVAIVEAPNPETTPTPITAIPTGTEVDLATQDAVLTVVYTLTACVNAGDYLRAFALFDDEYLRRIIDPEGLMGAEIAYELGKQFEAIHPSGDDDLTRISRVISVSGQPDGTVVVTVETMGGVDRDQDDLQIDLFVLQKAETGWIIIDGATDLPLTEDQGTPPAV